MISYTNHKSILAGTTERDKTRTTATLILSRPCNFLRRSEIDCDLPLQTYGWLNDVRQEFSLLQAVVLMTAVGEVALTGVHSHALLLGLPQGSLLCTS